MSRWASTIRPRTGAQASSAFWAHAPRPTGTSTGERSKGSPVACPTCSSARRVSSSRRIRSSGSALGSEPPSVATPWARERAASIQAFRPPADPPITFSRSWSRPWNGSFIATVACYGDDASSTTPFTAWLPWTA
jgi:hypothetical protein